MADLNWTSVVIPNACLSRSSPSLCKPCTCTCVGCSSRFSLGLPSGVVVHVVTWCGFSLWWSPLVVPTFSYLLQQEQKTLVVSNSNCLDSCSSSVQVPPKWGQNCDSPEHLKIQTAQCSGHFRGHMSQGSTLEHSISQSKSIWRGLTH